MITQSQTYLTNKNLSQNTIFAYLFANLIIGKGGLSDLNIGNAYACFGGAIFMILLGKFVVPKVPKLAEYSLGIAMILGIAGAILFGK